MNDEIAVKFKKRAKTRETLPNAIIQKLFSEIFKNDGGKPFNRGCKEEDKDEKD